MENKSAAFTLFTFLFFTVSAARLPVDPPATNPSTVRSEDVSQLVKTSPQSVTAAGSNILLPGEKVKSDYDETTANNHLPEPEKTTNDLTPRTNFTRFHPINRHFHGTPRGPRQIGTHRRPCRKRVTSNRIPRTETFDKNYEITSSRADNSIPQTFRGEVPSNWLKVKHHYGSRRHHNNHHNNNNNKDNVINTKQFDREKLKSLIRQHKQRKREEEAGLMRSIRKFLKHTFD